MEDKPLEIAHLLDSFISSTEDQRSDEDTSTGAQVDCTATCGLLNAP